jgi:hypothetical protein
MRPISGRVFAGFRHPFCTALAYRPTNTVIPTYFRRAYSRVCRHAYCVLNIMDQSFSRKQIEIYGILESLIEFFFYVIVEVLFFCSGEILLSILSLGQRKLRWGHRASGKTSEITISFAHSTLAGLLSPLCC